MQPPHHSLGAPSDAWHHSRGGGAEPRPQSAPPQTWSALPPVRHREAPGASRPHKGGLPSIPSSESLERLRGAMAQVQAAQAHPAQHDMRAPPHGFRDGPEQERAPLAVPSPLEIMQMRQAAAAMAAAKYASRQAEGLLERGLGGRPEGRAGPADGGRAGSARVALDGMAISPAVVEERQRQWLLMQQHQQALLQHRLQQQQQQQQQGQMSEEQFQAAMLAQQQLARMHAWRGPHPALPHPLAALSLGLGMGLGPPPLQPPPGHHPKAVPHPMPQRHAQPEGGHPLQRVGGSREDGPGQGQGSESRPLRSSLASVSQRASSPQTVSYQSNPERPDFEREHRYVMQQRARQQHLHDQQHHQQQHSQQQQAASPHWGAASLDSSQQGLPLSSQRRSPGPSSWGAGAAQSQEVQGAMPRVRSREQLSGDMHRSRSRESLERHPLAQQQRVQPLLGRHPQVPRTLSPTSTAPSSFEAGSGEHGIRGGPQTSAGAAGQRPPEREYGEGGKEGPDSRGEEWEERRSAEAVRQARVRMSHLAGPSLQHDERAHARPSSAPRVPAFSGAVSTGARPEGRSEGGPQRRLGSAQEGSRGAGPGREREWGGRDAGQAREGLQDAFARQGGRASPVSGGSARGPLVVREWLNRPERSVDRVENLHLFRQVLLLLEAAHRQGTVVRGVRPSNLVLTGALKVSLADAEGGVGTPKVVSSATRSNTSGRLGSSHPSGPRRAPSGSSQGSLPNRPPTEASPNAGTSVGPGGEGPEGPETGSGMLSAGQGGAAVSTARPGDEGRQDGAEGHGGEQEGGRREAEGAGGRGGRAEKWKQGAASPVKRAMSPGEAAEATWYTSPEEMMGHAASPMSDMYSLGVLFFELFLPPSAPAERARVMADLRHRILPPWLLLEHSKEAAFMLWLLHPEPNARPRARDVLQSDLLAEATDALAERQAAIDLEEAEAETEVLAEFLQAMAAQKAAAAAQLRTDLLRLSHDIQEVGRRRAAQAPPGEELEKRWGGGGEAKGAKRKRNEGDDGGEEEEEEDEEEEGGGEVLRSPAVVRKAEARRSKRSRVMRNFEHLEKVYFATRWSSSAREGGALAGPLGGDGRRPGSTQSGSELRSGGEPSASNREPGSSLTGVLNPPRKERHRSRAPGGGDWLGAFFDSLCKFARYSRFEVRATLRHGDLLNTANMVCSLGFDRDDEFFATAGVCKRIKVFECNAVLSEGVDIHYPVVEMVSRSKLSSICWNNYIKSHIASSDYEGIVQLWDASTSQVVMHYEEHEKRAWSVDFSRADPTRLASGGDDGCVKLWSISQEPSVATIKTKANVCCVQFSAESSHLLAFGSADYKVYAYDLRATRAPLAVLAGHGKAVSYVKFVDGGTLVSASTDNTLKLWDLAKGTNPTTAPAACTLSYTGHTNEKNFVGLSVSDGYIACGSENNAVYCYHKSLPMPMASHAFRGADPVTGQEIEDDAGQFVSSVCWREKSNMLVAANSMGNIKLLEMV